MRGRGREISVYLDRPNLIPAAPGFAYSGFLLARCFAWAKVELPGWPAVSEANAGSLAWERWASFHFSRTRHAKEGPRCRLGKGVGHLGPKASREERNPSGDVH